jgi:hypothetical protein
VDVCGPDRDRVVPFLDVHDPMQRMLSLLLLLLVTRVGALDRRNANEVRFLFRRVLESGQTTST